MDFYLDNTTLILLSVVAVFLSALVILLRTGGIKSKWISKFPWTTHLLVIVVGYVLYSIILGIRGYSAILTMTKTLLVPAGIIASLILISIFFTKYIFLRERE